jgi:hypothetical protein
MYIEDLWFYTKFVHLLVYVGDYGSIRPPINAVNKFEFEFSFTHFITQFTYRPKWTSTYFSHLTDPGQTSFVRFEDPFSGNFRRLDW